MAPTASAGAEEGMRLMVDGIRDGGGTLRAPLIGVDADDSMGSMKCCH
jgi:hypothetical protein